MSVRIPASMNGRTRDESSSGLSLTVEPEKTGYKVKLPAIVSRVRSFLRLKDGAGSITTLLSILVLLLAFAGVAEIVSSAYAADKYRRAAWSAAYHLALSPAIWGNAHLERALACRVIKAELELSAAFDCGSTWTFEVYTGVSPMNLLNGTSPDAAETHTSMVVVEIGWDAPPWSWLSEDSEDNVVRSRVARGIARGEPLE